MRTKFKPHVNVSDHPSALMRALSGQNTAQQVSSLVPCALFLLAFVFCLLLLAVSP